ncbi:DUF4440 domain-containing protein [Heyndrickxia ginsengihumi]|uniref:DUF4440 domain-containing protein n=2 Tax=Heyndrickxia ginsengihumi TaxID=363870 RepID=A0A6M0P6Y6_9BACI|nr:DUF4440 domain-containing protein [Heyndrickxia ginsengihumi]MBE6184499.1 DUF4440 domain-containing protein [Bacillus sp. (in: firmicutes)]NEY20331.1 DUF4440 domain-containing protein [Heyndrickxia ginsengihumi]
MERPSSLKEHLYFLETQLLKPEIRKSQSEMDKFIADDFIEFTSSGKKKNKQDCLNGLAVPKMECFHFAIKELSSNIVQTTFEIKDHTNSKVSLRSSLWKKQADGNWQIIFHQGTIVQS